MSKEFFDIPYKNIIYAGRISYFFSKTFVKKLTARILLTIQ